MGKIIKCFKCGTILARVKRESSWLIELEFYVFDARLELRNTSLGPYSVLWLICSCGQTTEISKSNITEEEMVAESSFR